MPRVKQIKSRHPNRIKELREQAGIRQVRLAADFEVEQSTVVRWEQNGPPRDLIPALAKYLGTDPMTLMGWDERKAA